LARFSFIILVLAAMAVAGAARAQSRDPRVTLDASDPLLARAEADDADGNYASALDGYRAFVAHAPSNRAAPRAAARAEVLASHAEGEFVPLAKLERVRRDPARANDPAAIDALAADANAFPPGLVRVEARMLVAEAYLGRFSRPHDGLAELDKVIEDPRCDPVTRKHALRRGVDVLLADGETSAAVAWVRRGDVDPETRALVEARVRRTWAHRAALGVLGALFLLAAVAIARARSRSGEVLRALRRGLPTALLFCAFVGAAGGALASTYEAGNARPFLVFALAALPVILLARVWAGVVPAPPAARAARATLLAAAVAAVGFLVLEYVNAEYLRGFGL
jgi:hypothetical protein